MGASFPPNCTEEKLAPMGRSYSNGLGDNRA